MVVRHTYASVKLFKEYLQGESAHDEWANDSRVIRTLLEASSRRIDHEMGGRAFGPVTATREYDLGHGALRRNKLERSRYDLTFPDYWPSKLSGAGIIALGDWLISATTVTAYSDTARTSSTVLTAVSGGSGDYLLEPYNSSPKNWLKLDENTSDTFYGGQKTLAILGSWGWQSVTEDVGASVIDTPLSSSSATMLVTGGEEIFQRLSAGQTLLIESEQVYVTKADTGATAIGTQLTIERGVNGTTAASHLADTPVYVLTYPEDVVEVCLSIARNRWRERDAGAGALIGSGEMAISRPGSEELAILRRLNYYKGQREHGGVFV